MAIPGVRDLILLDDPQEVRLSPDGARLAVRVEHPRWDDNRYCSDVEIVDVATGRRHRLTHDAATRAMHWLSDDTLAVLKSDGSPEATAQVHVYDGLIGDGRAVTAAEHGVTQFAPFADGIVFLARKADDPEVERREEAYGSYVHVEAERGRTALYYLDLPRLAAHERELARADKTTRDALVRPEVELSTLLTEPVAIQSVVASPAGDAVYVNARPTDDLSRDRESSVHRIAVDAPGAMAEFLRREGEVKRRDAAQGIAEETPARRGQRDTSYLGTAARLALPERVSLAAVSPDGARLALRFPGRDARMSTHVELWVGERDALLDAATAAQARGVLRDVTAGLDEACHQVHWHDLGIDVSHAASTGGAITRLDPDGALPPRRLDLGEVTCAPSFAAFHTTRSGRVAFVGTGPRSWHEAWVLDDDGPGRLTDFGAQLHGLDLGKVRTITWTSTDGTEIEGVLRTPAGWDGSRRLPLAFVVHGGPGWYDAEELLPNLARFYYPAIQLAGEDVLILHPNYRGSVGRGRDFGELNVGNLGVGDLWDLESAIDHLDALGWIDTAKVGCMGWSQGGYISAFAGLHSDRFAAVSVGAGISDWYTYAVSNDIPDFTRDFVGTDLFPDDRSALTASAPISAIGRAHTPMLIQHGAQDQRVPLSNAMELYRGLQERGVPVELFVFPEFAHPITKPREHHAVLAQNLAWFRHHLLGAELELP